MYGSRDLNKFTVLFVSVCFSVCFVLKRCFSSPAKVRTYQVRGVGKLLYILDTDSSTSPLLRNSYSGQGLMSCFVCVVI